MNTVIDMNETARQATDRHLTEKDRDFLAGLLERAEQGMRIMAAVRYRALSALAGHAAYQDPVQDAATEVACMLRISENSAQAQVAEAQTLTDVLPETLDALAAGTVQITQVRALIEYTSGLDDAVARAVQARVLPLMPRQNPAATRKALSRAVLKADPDGAAHRKAIAVKHRRVVHYPEQDGMSTLAATLPAEQAVHAMSVIDAHARASKTKDDPEKRRTLDQARADAFYHLVTGNPTSYPPAVVHVTVPLDTLLHLDQEPGELTGYGPIDPHTVRTLAAREDALWRRLLTDPATGLVVQAEPTRYRPTEAVRRLVSARDGHCTFPTCTTPATKTDLDHIIAFDHRHPQRGGLTVPENLHPLCRHHHRLKHQAGWDVQRNETGETTWTSPTGREYTTAAA